MPNILDFSYEELGTNRYYAQQKRMLFKEITKDAQPFVVIGKDSLSVDPQVNGVYEPIIKNLIEYLAQNGYSDCLIDIGANIGLSSCQSGSAFKEIHCFEPNPICAAICKLNLQKFLPQANYHLHEYGLGEADRTATLKIPYGNSGGAFIADGVNAYSNEVLASKDNFQSFEARNYFEQPIAIKSAKSVLETLTQQLLEKERSAWVIKLDVEGYEPFILKALSCLPPTVRCVIIFESWDPNFDLQAILKSFGQRARAFTLTSQRSYQNLAHRVLKKLFARFAADLTHRLAPYRAGDSGDLVIVIDATADL